MSIQAQFVYLWWKIGTPWQFYYVIIDGIDTTDGVEITILVSNQDITDKVITFYKKNTKAQRKMMKFMMGNLKKKLFYIFVICYFLL